MSVVRVFGLTTGIHTIEDIGVAVPCGVVVDIPTEKAFASKDLWRAISQRYVFQLHAGHIPPKAPSSLTVASEVDDLRAQVCSLLEQNMALQVELEQKRLEAQLQQDVKLDAILLLLRQGVVSSGTREMPPQRTMPGVVEVDVPTFIPSAIRPEGVETHVEVEKSSSSSGGILGSSNALRKLRKNS